MGTRKDSDFPEEHKSTVDKQEIVEPRIFKFTWTIKNFSRLNAKTIFSETFKVDGFSWCVWMYPKENNLSMELFLAGLPLLRHGWSQHVQFSFCVVNQIHGELSIKKETYHQFNGLYQHWGFTSFMSLSDLYDPSKGSLVDDTCIIEAEVAVCGAVDYSSCDSKKEIHNLRLNNQGAICYMNSLLQSLYHIPYFQKALYQMPTTAKDNPSGSISFALRSLFQKLKDNDTNLATKELTKSFGWDTYDSSMQLHDVHDLNRVLCEKFGDKMKGTVMEGTIQQLFEGHNYIDCIDVASKTKRKESFCDLQLHVRGCRDVYESFDKYHDEEHGSQLDAKKSVLFIDFPPVLQLQLKRVEYDVTQDKMVKINDHYEFPLQLDLDRENGKYLSPEANRIVRNLYTLHSVLVHRGELHGGHYYAFIRPTLSDQWFKFDDERLTKEDTKWALEEQYGGKVEFPYNSTSSTSTKYSNAYMLVYIRESDKDDIMCNLDEKDIEEHLRIRLQKELEEKEDMRRYEAQPHLYSVIKVARDEDMAEQIGKNIYFDLVDHEKVRRFHIKKTTHFKNFKEEVAKEFGIPVQFQRFWFWGKRQNHTYRPSRPLTHLEEAQAVGQLWQLKLLLEVELGADRRPIPLPLLTKEDILIFFKLYDPEKEQLRYVGRLFAKSSGTPMEILSKLNEMVGFAPDEEIDLYEEIRFEPSVMCVLINKSSSFSFCEIEDGDIICFQKSLRENERQWRYPDVPSFLEYVHNSQKIGHFQSLEKPKEDLFLFYSADKSQGTIVPRVEAASLPSTFQSQDRRADWEIPDFNNMSLEEFFQSLDPESLLWTDDAEYQRAKTLLASLIERDLSSLPEFCQTESAITTILQSQSITTKQRANLMTLRSQLPDLLSSFSVARKIKEELIEKISERKKKQAKILATCKKKFLVTTAMKDQLLQKKALLAAELAKLQEEMDKVEADIANADSGIALSEKTLNELGREAKKQLQKLVETKAEDAAWAVGLEKAQEDLSRADKGWVDLRAKLVFLQP